jgi:hypothetical protein
MFKKITFYLIIGLVLRLVLISSTVHPDLRGFNLAAYFIAQKGEILTFYDHLRLLSPSDRLVEIYLHDGQGIFIYPPLAYLTHGLFNLVFYPLYPHDTFYNMINYWDRFLQDPRLTQLLFLLKLPYLIPDIICLVLIRKILSQKDRFLGSLFWIFNPVTIYSAYMVGQFDIFIAMFILLAIVLSKKSAYLGAIALAVAAGYKPFPLLFLPLLPGSFPKRILNTLVGFVSFLLIISPYLPSKSFRTDALLASQSDKLSYAKIMVSGSQYLSWFFVGLFVVYWFSLLRPKILSQYGWFAAALLPFYVFSHFHPQWFTWFAPLLTLCAASYRKSIFPAMGMLICFVIIVFSFEPSLNFGLFGIDFNFSLWLNSSFPSDQFVSIIRSLLAASGIVFLVNIKEPASSRK